VTRRKRLGNPAPEPSDHLSHQAQIDPQCFALKWSDHFSLHGQPCGLLHLQVSFAGEPKEVFAVSLAYPFTSNIPF